MSNDIERISKLPQIENEIIEQVISVNDKDIEKSCKKTKCNKASGKDELKNEHLKYMGAEEINVVRIVFNSTLHLEYIRHWFN